MDFPVRHLSSIFAGKKTRALLKFDFCNRLRVLAPGRGTALLGRSKAAGAGLSENALKAWVTKLPLAKVISDDSGVWVILRTSLPAGSDPWTHRLHGPENSQASSDTTLQAPFITQWWGLPRQEGFWGTTVVACNGRMFAIRGSRRPSDQVSLTARSVNNGIVLWQRNLSHLGADGKMIAHGGYIPGRSCTAATGDSLFLTDGKGVLQLDGETGAERNRIEGPNPDGQVKWFAVSGDLLAIMAGAPDVITSLNYQTVAANPVGRNLAVYDTDTNKELWHETVTGDIDERMIVARDRHLYCLVQGVGMVCRDLASGKVIWTQPDAELQVEFKTPETSIIRDFLVSLPVLSALQDVLVLRAKWVKNTVVLSRQDGKILWRKPTEGGSYRGLTACAVDNVWIGGSQPLDLKTGKIAKGPTFIASGCGPTISTPGYLVTCFGKVLDLKSGKVIKQDDIKSPCDVGSIISDGLMITMPSECGCAYPLKGYRVLTSAGKFQLHTAPDRKKRLAVLDKSVPAPVEITNADWPTYRHDSERSAGSPVNVGIQPKILWQWKPAGMTSYDNAVKAKETLGYRLAPDFLTTAPVAAGGYVWFASGDGTIRCIKADTGKEVWNFPTGAMIFAPPTIWKGRLLAGGGDGRIYCLDATTGRCLWKFLAAPIDRRVFWYGHLINTWPVIPGVVVNDNIAYAVAGYQKDNGIYAYALDPGNGKVLWEKDDAGKGTQDASNDGLGSFGNSAVGAGRLWINSSTSTPGSFDLKSGSWKPVVSGQFGSEIGVFDGKWIVHGGARLSETQDNLGYPLSSGFSVCAAESSSQSKLCDGLGMPAWDKNGSPTAEFPDRFIMDMATWKPSGIPVAFALAKDQFVAAYGQGKNFKVGGFRRTDGSPIWTVDLPEQPVFNRLALDRDGHVLVTLCDGSIICLGGPSIEEVTGNKDELVFHFSRIDGGLVAKDSPDGTVTGLTITDAKGVSKPLKGRIEGSNLTVPIKNEIPPLQIATDATCNLCAKDGTTISGFKWNSLRMEFTMGATKTLTFTASDSLDGDLWKTDKAYSISGAKVTKVEMYSGGRTVRLTTDKSWKMGEPIVMSYPCLPTKSAEGPWAEQTFTMAPGQPVGPVLLQEFLIGEVKEKINPATVLGSNTVDKDTKPDAGDKWKVFRNNSGIFDLLACAGKGNLNNAIAHAAVYICSDADRKVQLWAGSGGGVKIFVNGNMVHNITAVRGCTPDNDKIKDVQLVKGWNTILMAVAHGGGGWGFCLRIRDESGKDPVGLRYSTDKSAAP